MKKTFLTVLTGLSIAASAHAGAFEDGAAAYQAGRYEEAASAFEKAVAAKPSAAALYNLGTASFRAGKKGRAVASLLRASAISPRDKDIAWNLGVARASVSGPVSGERNFLKERAEKALNWISFDEAAALLAVALALFFLSAVFRFFSVAGAEFLRGFSVVAVLLTGGLVSWHAMQSHEPVLVIIGKSVPARGGPSVKENVLFTLREGAEARLLDETKDWYYAGVSDGPAGWIPRTAAETVR
jgi:tetratricopeptide (TPR) repeat protein